jgi:hypothetical protein
MIKENFISEMAFEGKILIKRNGFYGYLNEEGKILIEPQYISAGIFKDGRANVKTKEGWVEIDHEGKMIKSYKKQKNTFAFKVGDKVSFYYKDKIYISKISKIKEDTETFYVDVDGKIIWRKWNMVIKKEI